MVPIISLTQALKMVQLSISIKLPLQAIFYRAESGNEPGHPSDEAKSS
jgi:hypothetical protein